MPHVRCPLQYTAKHTAGERTAERFLRRLNDIIAEVNAELARRRRAAARSRSAHLGEKVLDSELAGLLEVASAATGL
jgi:hypothetical protein